MQNKCPLSISPVGQVFVTDPAVHDTAAVTKSGLVESMEQPFLGASPDGVIRCSRCGKGVLEIKYPFLIRSRIIRPAANVRVL